MKKLRFSELVKSSGRPQVATLWGDPRKDPAFGRAIRENRVLTVKQEPKSKKTDVGMIGFHQQPYAAYFIFPEPLPEVKDAQVIGIRYDLLDEGRVVGKATPSIKNKIPPPIKKKKTPGLKKFSVTMIRTARLETEMEVEAKDKEEAKERALAQAPKERFESSEAIFKNEVRGVTLRKSISDE